MAIVTKDFHVWFEVINKKGQKLTFFNNETPEHNFPIAFEVNFSDSPTPSVNTVTLYNLSKSHSDFFEKDEKVYLYANWGPHKKLISEGFITKVDVAQHDGTTDSKVINFTEGTDYNNVKANSLKVEKKKEVKRSKLVETTKPGHYENKIVNHHRKQVWVPAKKVSHRVKTRETKVIRSNKVYRKGTSYEAVIKGIAAQCGIKISKLQLHKNPVLKHAYTAKGKPLTLIKQLVAHTESSFTYVQGRLEIVDPKSEKRTWIDIDDQDLVQPPSTDSADSTKKKTWEITLPFVPEMVINTGINMKSHYLKGRFYVKSGQHTSDGENPQTQCSLLPM